MTANEQVLKSMHALAEKFSPLGVQLHMPPLSNQSLGTHYIEVDPGKMLAAQIHFQSQFCNPTGAWQGGFLCAAFDEVYGPLMYMACGRPAVTIEMSTSFVRPFTKNDEFIVVRAELVVRSRTLLNMKAEAKNKNGKLIATSTSHSLITTDLHLKSREGGSDPKAA